MPRLRKQHSTGPARFESATPGSQVEHSTDKPKALKHDSIYNIDMLF